MEEEQLQALLRDLDALRQRPDDPASIDRVTPLSRRAAPWISAVCLSISSLLPCLSNYRSLFLLLLDAGAGSGDDEPGRRRRFDRRSRYDLTLRARRAADWAVHLRTACEFHFARAELGVQDMSAEVVDSNPYSRLMALQRMGVVENYERIRDYSIAIVVSVLLA